MLVLEPSLGELMLGAFSRDSEFPPGQVIRTFSTMLDETEGLEETSEEGEHIGGRLHATRSTSAEIPCVKCSLVGLHHRIVSGPLFVFRTLASNLVEAELHMLGLEVRFGLGGFGLRGEHPHGLVSREGQDTGHVVMLANRGTNLDGAGRCAFLF